MDALELLSTQNAENQDYNKVIAELKSKRLIPEPDTATSERLLDPLKHDVCDPIKRPNKMVKVDSDDPQYKEFNITGASEQQSGYRLEAVARVALALQKLIVKRAVSFLFGNPVELDAQPENDKQKQVLMAVKKVLYDNKSKSLNRKIARQIMSYKEVAELWYPIEKTHSNYGFNSKFKLRCAILSAENGDKLYPYFNENGDMTAFSREFSVKEDNRTSKNYFETYTNDNHYMWQNGADGYALCDGFPKENVVKKIPVVFGSQEQYEWEDVQVLIDRLEKLLSNFADTNDYHAAPKIFVKGGIKGFAKKGESGAIIEGDENSDASYLSWANAPESVKLEIETLLRMIYTITQTPDISFEAVKGIGSISGIALKLLFMDAHLKVADHQEVFDEYLQRRINVIKAFIGKFNTQLDSEAENMMIEPVITPYIIKDEAAELKIWSDANGGNAVMSQKASFQKAGLTSDPEEDYKQYQEEQSASVARQNAFVIGEPTPA